MLVPCGCCPSPPLASPKPPLLNSRAGSVQCAKHAPIMTDTKGDKPSSATEITSPVKPSALRVPPPENQEATQTRLRVIVAFWVVIVFLGLPIWWKTTSIYRAHLPIQEMVDWADSKVCCCYRHEFGQSLTASLDLPTCLPARYSHCSPIDAVTRISASLTYHPAHP